MATGFCGTTYHTLDGKNRLVLPAGLRFSLGATFWMTKGLDGCLWAMTADDWTGLRERFQKLDKFDPDSRRVREHFLGSAVETRVDDQGRMTLSAPLRDAARIDTQLVVVGVGDTIEFWSQAVWETRQGAELAPQSVEESLGRLIADGKLTMYSGEAGEREI
jgi:MraZ protein